MGNKDGPARIEAAAANTIDPDDEAAFNAWVDLYHDRIMSVTGIAPDTRQGDRCDGDGCQGGGCDGVTEEYYDVLWRLYRSGADAVATADEDLKHVPPEQRQSDQSADDFRKEWREANARFGEFWDRG